MEKRTFWIDRIEKAWKRKSILWLSGVRRAGKTTLALGLDKVEYFDCELPRIRRLMEDPEEFLSSLNNKRIVLDEIHRLDNPSELLKIAADHFPKIKVLATGSSTLEATVKFKDTLTGRKEEIWLTPMNTADLKDFKKTSLLHRLKNGGLPPFFLSKETIERDYQEWIDSYWAKDIQELFRIERRGSFQKFLELLFVNSGGLFEATRYTSPCEISRTTVSNYLNVLEATRVAHIVRPFSTHQATEIISIPKVYTFDTGFVCYYRGWNELRSEDKGALWEHYVLNEMQSRIDRNIIYYWRDKRGHEIDFILKKRGKPPIAIECKWSEKSLSTNALNIFRQKYPQGENWIVSQDVDRSFKRKENGFFLEWIGIDELINRL